MRKRYFEEFVNKLPKRMRPDYPLGLAYTQEGDEVVLHIVPKGYRGEGFVQLLPLSPLSFYKFTEDGGYPQLKDARDLKETVYPLIELLIEVTT